MSKTYSQTLKFAIFVIRGLFLENTCIVKGVINHDFGFSVILEKWLKLPLQTITHFEP